MLLGIEIGGTKLQLGVGTGKGPPLAELERIPVEPDDKAERIRQHIQRIGRALIEKHPIAAVGVGFGGPVDAAAERTVISHQVEGWKDFPLAAWCRRTLGKPTVIGNDSDLAGLAEARFGAGRQGRAVFYTNCGSGIGGALVIDGQLYRGSSGVASELGHLRPGLNADHADQTVESLASGWAIAAAARALCTEAASAAPESEGDSGAGPAQTDQRIKPHPGMLRQGFVRDLLGRCHGQLDRLTAAIVAEAANQGNLLAQKVFGDACRAYGWGIAQMITLLAPDVVVVGGGVSLAGDQLWFRPLREHVDRYVFPPLKGSFAIVPAELGEEMVLYGALALAASG